MDWSSKVSEMPVDFLQDWNKQFSPADLNKWGIPADENQELLRGNDAQEG